MKSQEKKFTGEHARWWKFSEYDIEGDAICVRPKASAVQYDPLSIRLNGEMAETRQRSRGANDTSLAYRSLIAVVTDTGTVEDTDQREVWSAVPRNSPTKELQNRILAWTREHGILGVLHHRAREIAFAGPEPESGSLKWVRAASYWQKMGTPPRAEPLSILTVPHGGYDLVPFDALNQTFFGGKLNPRAVPDPASEAFHALYREDLEEWLNMAVDFAEAVMESRHEVINSILSVAPPEYLIVRDSVKFTFKYGSLIEALAAQFIQDRRAGQILDFCRNRACGQVFFHSDPRAQFCSVRCANAERQRQYRAAAKRQRDAAKRRRDERKKAR